MAKTKFVHTFLEDSAAVDPRKPAVFAQERWLSYGEINSDANRLAHLLIERGLVKGDRVAILMENSPQYVISYYAILKAAGVTVALNTENTPSDISFILRDCGARFLITNERFKGNIPIPQEGSRPSAADGPALKALLIWSDREQEEGSDRKEVFRLPESLDGRAAENPMAKVVDLDFASIVYTSGSTGKPRGAVLSHLNIVSNTRSIIDYLELTSDDRIMVVLPFYYIYGKSLLNTHFSVGGSVVIDNRFMYPNVVIQTMLRQEVTGFAGVPSTFAILLRRSNFRTQKLPKLRYVTQAGGPMAPVIQKEVASVIAPAKLFVMYGATEASARLSYLSPDDLPRKWGSIGKAIPNVELFIADALGEPLPRGQEGEIVARGSNIMSGYWNHPDETRKVLRNGLYYSGDIGRADEEGFIYIVGRSKDMLKVGGNRVGAKEIEDTIYEHPGVIETAVIGVPDDVLGEAPKAYLVVSKEHRSTILEEMPAFLQARLASYKLPKYYEIRDSLPKNEAGKIQKLKLQ